MIYRKPMIITEFNLKDKTKSYALSIQTDTDTKMWPHGPRLKVSVGGKYNNTGIVPVLNSKDLQFDDLLEWQEGRKFIIKDDELRRRITAFAVYGRDEILNYADNPDSVKTKAELLRRFKEFDKAAKTINDCRKLADSAWENRND